MEIELRQRFRKLFRKLVAKRPATAVIVLQKLLLFSQAPNHHSLALHKLQGHLKDVSSISVEYDLRILTDFSNPAKPLLADIGTHDEVY